MGRNLLHVSEHGHTRYIGGMDHTLGEFLQIYDTRFTEEDAENLLLDWDAELGFTTNLIDVVIDDIKTGPSNIQPKVETFIANYLNTLK